MSISAGSCCRCKPSRFQNQKWRVQIILPYKPPFTLGHDVAGVVTKVGSNISKFKVGDEVYARPADHRIGAFAELISINEDDVALKAKNLSMEEAASTNAWVCNNFMNSHLSN
jgi:NADPH:quinone reductase-like Zn-dependent oxidoreductase